MSPSPRTILSRFASTMISTCSERRRARPRRRKSRTRPRTNVQRFTNATSDTCSRLSHLHVQDRQIPHLPGKGAARIRGRSRLLFWNPKPATICASAPHECNSERPMQQGPPDRPYRAFYPLPWRARCQPRSLRPAHRRRRRCHLSHGLRKARPLIATPRAARHKTHATCSKRCSRSMA